MEAEREMLESGYRNLNINITSDQGYILPICPLRVKKKWGKRGNEGETKGDKGEDIITIFL